MFFRFGDGSARRPTWTDSAAQLMLNFLMEYTLTWSLGSLGNVGRTVAQMDQVGHTGPLLKPIEENDFLKLNDPIQLVDPY
jgi:hypothetical protein